MTAQLPRVPDTLQTNDAIKRWIVEHFGNYYPWEWVDEINCRFRLVGRKSVYQLGREGKWFVVFRLG